MKLYNYWRSSSSWRVRIALAHKNLPYDYVPVNLVRDGGEQHRAEFSALNPMEQVPALELVHGGKTQTLAQSLAILEYLEETHPTPPLLPKDPMARARVREIANLINAGIQPLQNLSVLQYVESAFKADRAVWATHWITAGLKALEALAKPLAKRCLVGDDVSLADACLVPQLYAARRFDVDMKPFPTLLRVEEYVQTLPAFVKAHAGKQIDAPASA